MKDLVRGFVKWLIIILATLTIILWGIIFTAYCQYQAAKPIETKNIHPKHKDLEDFEETVGFRTIEAMSKDNRLLFYKKEYKLRVFLGSFGYDKYTRFDGPFEGKLCALYCKTHNFAYIVAPCKEK